MKLPKKNESETVWETDDDGMACRIRIECVPELSSESAGSYLLHTEICDAFEDEDGQEVADWIAGSVPLHAFKNISIKVGLAMREVADLKVANILMSLTKSDVSFPMSKRMKLAYLEDWSVSLILQDCMQDGTPLLELSFSRPLVAEEMLAVLKRLATFVDDFESHKIG